ncbi:MAG: FAH family protein, partial [Pseudomonas sp.]|nr:FAH family protein [Pseudomonas sp.]
QFLRPGDIHVHYFGTATLSFADGIQAQPGDTFEISLPAFGEPLRNAIAPAAKQVRPGRVKSL